MIERVHPGLSIGQQCALLSIMEWRSCIYLSWGTSNRLGADFCAGAVYAAIHRFGPLGIMNRDEGPQFTPFAWTDCLRRSGAGICALLDGSVQTHLGTSMQPKGGYIIKAMYKPFGGATKALACNAGGPRDMIISQFCA